MPATILPPSLSPQQSAFLDWAERGRGSCVLEAVAGAGKTTSIIEAVCKMPGQKALLAFNKRIAEELQARIEARGLDWRQAKARTAHSFGYAAFRKSFGSATIDERKVARIIDAAGLTQPYGPIIEAMVGFAKQRGLGLQPAYPAIESAEAWLDIIGHFDLLELLDEGADAPRIDELTADAVRVLRASNADTGTVDFSDMIYLPLLHGAQFWRYDVVIVDEAQDTNPARRALYRALLQPGGRLIAVGDSRQAIYGFTGADSDALELIARGFNAQRLPLTVSFRCPRAVVEFARQWVSHIEAAPSAPAGSVTTIAHEAFLDRDDLDGAAAILCRNTAPLVRLAFTLIARGTACRIEGRDIAGGLVKLATRWTRIKTLGALRGRLADYREREVAKATARDNAARAQTIEDQVAVLEIVIDECQQHGETLVGNLVARIESIFADNVRGMLTLSTIHKSKGREWPRVFWLDRAGTCPSRHARQRWQIEQEHNLCYVAATRAQNELIELRPALKAEAAPAPQIERVAA